MKDYNNISKASTSHRVIRTVLIIVAFTVLLSALTSARNVVSNSADWRDVYSTILYGNLAGITPHFLTGTAHGPIMLYEISTSSDGVEIITSADRPFYIGYEALFRARGYQSVQETILNSANLELARRLTQINNYIIIDTTSCSPTGETSRISQIFLQQKLLEKSSFTAILTGK
jgi:hypothetical protein